MAVTMEDPRLARINRSRKIAEAISSNAFASPSQASVGQSGPYQVVKANPFGGIAQLAQAISGQRGIEKADREESALRTTMLAEETAKKQKRRDEVAKALTTYMPAAQDPNSDPQTRQAALVAAMSSLDPEDAGGALSQILKSSLDPREMQNQRVAAAMQGIDKEWRGRQKQPRPQGPVLTPTGGEGEGQVMPVGLQTDTGMPVDTAVPTTGMPVDTAVPTAYGEDDSESPAYYQHVAQRLEAAGLPREAEKARKEAEKQAKERARAERSQKQDDYKIIAGLRDDFRQDTKEMFLVRDHYSRVLKSAENPSPAGDVSLIFAYMKMLDPNSVVREGEYATARNAGNVEQSIIGAYNKLLTQEGSLDPRLRADFVARSGQLYDAIGEQHAQVVKGYEETAKRLGQDPANIVRPLVRPGAKAAPGAPKAAPKAEAKAPAEETKTLGGKNYVKRNGQWFEVVK
jgi:hypothetical protein